MIPFCRTVEEGHKVQAEMAKHGLRRGENGLEIYVMCEIPSNVILADEFADKLTIAKLNVDDNPAMAQQFNVMSIPTLLVFKNGEQVKQIVGAKGKAELLNDLSEFTA